MAPGTTRAPDDRDVEVAARGMLESLKRHPDDVALRRQLAELYRSAGWRYDEAWQWAAVLNADPGDETARNRLSLLRPIIETVDDAAHVNPPNIRLHIHQRTVVISLKGVASPCTDDGPSAHFEQQHMYIKRLLDCGYTGFVIELRGLSFLGSHFLSALIMWARSVARRGGRLVVCELRLELRGILRVTQLTQLVACCESFEHAISQVQGSHK